MTFHIDTLGNDLFAIERSIHALAGNPHLESIPGRETLIDGLVQARTRLQRIRALQIVEDGAFKRGETPWREAPLDTARNWG